MTDVTPPVPAIRDGVPVTRRFYPECGSTIDEYAVTPDILVQTGERWTEQGVVPFLNVSSLKERPAATDAPALLTAYAEACVRHGFTADREGAAAFLARTAGRGVLWGR